MNYSQRYTGLKKTGRGKNWLKRGERCPLHKGSIRCECHGQAAIREPFQSVRRVDDKFHPRGYREQCSPSELRRRKHTMIQRGDGCWLCIEAEKPEEQCRFTSYDEIDLEHREPKGMGGARRDDHWDNLALAHHACNMEKGSKRIG